VPAKVKVHCSVRRVINPASGWLGTILGYEFHQNVAMRSILNMDSNPLHPGNAIT
jgi:hypothetical protein